MKFSIVENRDGTFGWRHSYPNRHDHGATQFTLTSADVCPHESYDNRDEAIEAMLGVALPYHVLGDTAYVVTDGRIVCIDCARDEIRALLSNPTAGWESVESWELAWDQGDDYITGIYCDHGCVIVEQACRECGTSASELDLPLYVRISGDEAYCGHCIAQAVIRTRSGDYQPNQLYAYKIGKSAYDVHIFAPFRDRLHVVYQGEYVAS